MKKPQIEKRYLEVFSTPQGEEVLQDLRNMTIEMIIGDGVLDHSNIVALAHKEGQRFLVKHIEKEIEKAKRKSVADMQQK